MYFADQLPLWLVAADPSRVDGAERDELGRVADCTASVQQARRQSGVRIERTRAAGVYAPALLIVLRHENAGPLPSSSSDESPGGRRGSAERRRSAT